MGYPEAIWMWQLSICQDDKRDQVSVSVDKFANQRWSYPGSGIQSYGMFMAVI